MCCSLFLQTSTANIFSSFSCYFRQMINVYCPAAISLFIYLPSAIWRTFELIAWHSDAWGHSLASTVKDTEPPHPLISPSYLLRQRAID